MSPCGTLKTYPARSLHHVSTYLRMYLRMYVCTYLRMYVCTYVCMYVYPEKLNESHVTHAHDRDRFANELQVRRKEQRRNHEQMASIEKERRKRKRREAQ